LRPGLQALVRALLPRLAIDLASAAGLDPFSLFGGAVRAVWLEIGFGAGEHLAMQAEAHPDIGFIGCEVFENGVARLLGQIERRGLSNIQLYPDDARLLLATLSPAVIGHVFILFPDPWPKARHHKRRIVSRDTLNELARVMRPGAELRLATDDPGYFSWMLEQLTGHPAFEWLARRPCDWRERPPDWPATRYEQKARAGARAPFFCRARRR
jgi:tRNA (guanine-N7-)-methyltransferase